MKSSIKSIVIALVAMSLFCFSTIACKKENQKGKLTVAMTDAPADFTAVNVDIIAMDVHSESDGWINIPIKEGIYNLLELQNDVTVVLANDARIPAGHLTQIRLKLGSRNSISDSLGTYPLKVPSGAESGLKINIHERMEPGGTLKIVLDFDAKASVVIEGNGTFSLKPVITVKSVVRG